MSFGEGDNVIFLHGWGASVSAFLFVAKRIDCRATLIDFAGFGDSDPPDRPFGIDDYAADVLTIMDKLNIPSATLVCHSFGGRVGLYLAANYPDRVSKLALVDSAGLKPRRGVKYYIRVGVHKLLRKLKLKGLKGSADYRKLSPVMKETFKRVVNDDLSRCLKDIACPTAIFWGNDDRETPPYMAYRLKRGIADSEIFWLKGGHFAYVDDFYVFLAVLNAFLR